MRVRHHLFIRERDGGHTYDMTDAEASTAFPWLQDYWATFGPFFSRPPGGESLAQVCERVYAFLQKLARTNPAAEAPKPSPGSTPTRSSDRLRRDRPTEEL